MLMMLSAEEDEEDEEDEEAANSSNRDDVIKLLLCLGADPNAKDKVCSLPSYCASHRMTTNACWFILEWQESSGSG